MLRTCEKVGPLSCSAVSWTLSKNAGSLFSILPGSRKKRPHHVGLQCQVSPGVRFCIEDPGTGQDHSETATGYTWSGYACGVLQ